MQTLEGNPGILPVRQGQAYVQIDHWTIIKVIYLDQIHTDLNNIVKDYDLLNNLTDWSNPQLQEFRNMKTHTDFIRDITSEKYHQLVPRRFKRGLIDPLGSVVKLITGNLDHTDALRYDRLITQLQNNQIVATKRLTLVTEIFDSLINTTETMNKNAVAMENRLKRVEIILREFSDKGNNVLFSTYISSIFSIIISSFRTIFIRLSEIETALALSKVSILHQALLNSTELLYHLKDIAKSASLVYPPTEMYLLNLEETIRVKSYVKGNRITFVMEVPLTDNYTYNYYKMYSLPIFHESDNKTFTIFPKYPFLLAKGNKYSPIERPCRLLAAGEHFLCTPDNQVTYPEPTCIEQLMKFDNDLTYCTRREIRLEEIKVQRVNPDSWILFTRIHTTVTKHCDSDVSKQPVFGTYFLTLNEPCDLEINGVWLRHHRQAQLTGWTTPLPLVTLPHLPASVNISSAGALNMDGIALDEIKYMVYSLKHSEMSNSVLSETETYETSARLGHVILGLVVISFIAIIVFALCRKIRKIVKTKQNYQENSQIDSPDNFPLRDGGVMIPPRPSVLD